MVRSKVVADVAVTPVLGKSGYPPKSPLIRGTFQAPAFYFPPGHCRVRSQRTAIHKYKLRQLANIQLILPRYLSNTKMVATNGDYPPKSPLIKGTFQAPAFYFPPGHCRVRSQRTAIHKYKLRQLANIQLILPRYLSNTKMVATNGDYPPKSPLIRGTFQAPAFYFPPGHCRVRSQRTAIHKYKLRQLANIQLILPRYLSNTKMVATNGDYPPKSPLIRGTFQAPAFYFPPGDCRVRCERTAIHKYKLRQLANIQLILPRYLSNTKMVATNGDYPPKSPLIRVTFQAPPFYFPPGHCRVRSQRTAIHKYKLRQLANIQLILPRYLSNTKMVATNGCYPPKLPFRYLCIKSVACNTKSKKEC